jgi:hypothetical protein
MSPPYSGLKSMAWKKPNGTKKEIEGKVTN